MILDRHGNPIVIEKEKLGTGIADFVSATGTSYDLLPDPDPVLRKKGESASVLGALMADDQVTMAVQLRKRKVLTRGAYEYSPGQPRKGKEATSGAVALCDNLVDDLAAIKLKPVFSGILDANFYGYSVFELYWRVEGSRLRLAGIEEKPREWFSFDGDGNLVFLENGQAVAVPYGKFLVVQHEPTYENPFGLRLLSRCLWPVAFKQAGVDWTMRFLERYGMAFQVAKAPQNFNAQDRQRLAGDLASMIMDAVAVLPYGAEHQLVESKGQGAAGHLDFVNHWNSTISKVLSCQTRASENTGKSGGYADSQTSYEVLEDVAVADENLVADAMNDLAVLYTLLNKSGEYPPVFGFEEADDFIAQAELDEKRYAVGVRFTKAHFTRHGLDEDEFYLDEEPSPSTGAHIGAPLQAGEAGGTPLQFSVSTEVQKQKYLDEMVTRNLPKAVKGNKAFVGQLEALINKAKSYEDLASGLAELAGSDLSQDEQVELLGEMLVASELYGMAVAEDSGQ